MPTKAQLMEILRLTHQEILRLAGSLSKAERAVSGTAETWAARDVLVHISEWIRRMTGEIAGSLRGEPGSGESSFDATNAAIFEMYRERSWEDIQTLIEQAHKGLVDLVEPLTEEALNDPNLFPGQKGRPLWRSFAGNGFLHPLVHLGAAYIERGEREYANRLYERYMQLAAGLDPSPEWQAMVSYDTGCHYALMGESQCALEKIEQALRLQPGLADWSREDPDLAGLRESGELQALLERLDRPAALPE